MAIKIMISAGELSGDQHGVALLADLQHLLRDAEFFGMGGRNLKAQGLEILVDAERSGSMMGVTEIIGGIGRIIDSWKIMKKALYQRRPDVLVIINYSEFNLRLAKVAKRLNIKVIFYIPPQVWAWRPNRVKTINQVCDLVASIFPFEKSFYSSRGCEKVIYVGHPFATQFEKYRITPEQREQMRGDLGISQDQKLVLLFPGSRRKELTAHLDFVFESFRQVQNQNSKCCGVLVSAHQDWVKELKEKIPTDLNISVVHGDSLKLLQIGDCGLIKSGTSNLQATFAHLPFVMYYRPSRVTAFFIRRLVKGISQYSIVNILRPNTVPEVVGEVLSPDIAAKSLLSLVIEGPSRSAMLQGFEELIGQLNGADLRQEFQGATSASQRTARLVQELVGIRGV